MLEFRDIRYTYHPQGEEIVALRGVALELREGERVVVLGPNGSGKSTLARLANGLMLPSEGEVIVDGSPTSDAACVRTIRERVGLVLQDPENAIVAMNVTDDIAFGPENLGLPREEIQARVVEALKIVGLSQQADREPHTLSGGQKQRLAIAGVVAMRPRYIVLDEPTSMLDPVGQQEVRTTIASLQHRGHGILHITHDLSDLVGADRAIVFEEGLVAFEGTPQDLLQNEDRFSTWGLDLPDLFKVAHDFSQAGLRSEGSVPTVESLLEALCLS